MIKCPRCGEECTREKIDLGIEVTKNTCSNCDTQFFFYESIIAFLTSKKPASKQ